MVKVIGVSFYNSKRIYYFSPGQFDLTEGENVIVETERGLQFGNICTKAAEYSEEKLVMPLKKVIRKATKSDKEIFEKNLAICDKALSDAKNIATKLKLDMNFINATLTFDKSQLVLMFVADERIDFRELAKKMASIYKTRIELRQIGVRDKAKNMGGLGPCGRILCCNLFLSDFDSVSINMAKNQFLALNSNKINGVCGRLLCCLTYEDNQYTEMKKQFLNIGMVVNYKQEKYKVIAVDIFKKRYIFEKTDKTILEVTREEYEANK